MSPGPVANDRIPHRALILLLPAMVLETGVLTLPGQLIAESGTWGWLAIVIISLFVGMNVTLIYILFRRHGFADFPQLLRSLVGSWPARAILALAGVTLVMRAARIARIGSELITQELLSRTPQWAVLLPGLLVVAYITWHGFEPLSRFVAIVFPFYYTVTILILILALLRVEVQPFFVLADWSGEGLWRAVMGGIPDVQGYSMLLVWLPWAWQAGRAFPALMGGWLLLFAFGLLLMLSMIGALGVSAATTAWPTLDLIDLISVPGLFVERMESLFFIIWLLMIFTASMLSVFAGAYLVSTAMLGYPAIRIFIPIVSFLVLIITLLPPTLTTVVTAARQLRLLGWIEISLPLFLLLISTIRGRPNLQ